MSGGLGLKAEFFKAAHSSHSQVSADQQAEEEPKHGPFGRQRSLGFDPPAKLLIDAFDDVGAANRLMERPGETPEGEQILAGFFQAGGYRSTLLAPLLQETAACAPGMFVALGVNDGAIIFARSSSRQCLGALACRLRSL